MKRKVLTHRFYTLFAAAAVLCSNAVLAQTDTGIVVGVVKDSAGAVIPGATVTARGVNALTTRAAMTSSFGTFEIPVLPVGEYEIVTEAAGFKKYIRQPVSVEVNQEFVFADRTANFDLAVIKQIYWGAIDRSTGLEFRAEFFNLPNHPQFGPPDLDFSSPTFGRIFTTARGTTERQIQFGLKLSF